MVAPKKRKDGMPKKHNPKKKETGMTRERKPLPQGVSQIYPSIHPSTHTLAPLIEIT